MPSNNEERWNLDKIFDNGPDYVPYTYVSFLLKESVKGRAIECKEWERKRDNWEYVKSPSWRWDHFMYRLKEENDEELMTKLQLMEWLAKGNGFFTRGLGQGFISISERESEFNEPVSSDIRLFRFDDLNTSLKPTKKVYLEDCFV